MSCGRPAGQVHAGQLAGCGAQTKVDAIENRTAVHPRLAAIGPAVGRLSAEDRLTQLPNELRLAGARIGAGGEGPKSARDELKGRLHLRAVRRSAEELARCDNTA